MYTGLDTDSSYGTNHLGRETSHSFNTGFDFAFWGGKLGGSVEYFSRKTTDMD